jgi:hypothetical protein
MRINRIWIAAALVLLALTSGTGCLLFPQLEDKVVDLVTSGSVAADFQARGELNTHNQTKTIAIRDSIDIRKVLDDAGIELEKVKSITLGGVSYCITKAEPGRSITNGTITVQREGGSAAVLVSGFAADAGALTGWITPTLDPAGVTELNNLLADILDELQGGGLANEVITYHVSGASVPADVETNFDYQLRITISIVGTVETKWIK